MLGLITFFVLAAFSLLYINAFWSGKPEFVEKAVAFLKGNLTNLALFGVFYGLIAALLTPITVFNSTELLVRLVANILIFLMALPYAIDRLVEKYGDKMNAAIIEEVRNIVGHVTRQEKIVGIVGTAVTVLLFAVLFR